MSEGKSPSGSNPQSGPDAARNDVAQLHAWANLHGANYWDFSASRAQTREKTRDKARQRGRQGTGDERRRRQNEVQSADEARPAERTTLAEEVKRAADRAARMAEQAAAQQEAWNQPLWDRFAPVTSANAPLLPPRSHKKEEQMTAESGPESFRRAAMPVGDAGGLESGVGEGPAWLTRESAEIPARPMVANARKDTLQGSRDRLTSRWFALKGIFEGTAPPPPVAPPPAPGRAPVLAVFSLAGGVGKTCLAATLGRALSSRGERVLLVDTASYGLLPFYFGAREQRPGVLRTFSPPSENGDVPIQMITIDPETAGPENAAEETVASEIQKYSRGASRVIVDLATASGTTTRRVMRLAPLVLIPVVPDLNSVVSVSAIDTFVQHNSSAGGNMALPYYVLNQFDPSTPLHLDVREVLREQLGDRLLPFALRRAPAMSEALAEGMTVMDYAPNSSVVEDFGHLAGWLRSLSAAAASGSRGVRWSEK